ncbi:MULTISPECIES: phenylacetate--CoA ligase family protein [Methylobacterium]|uniref:phenylacetate--CoA ligase family protein n=1 Tax=Methylobacterium TaxID=407 RepID=UPI0013EADDC0|nr:AMP-binding protein [Methylobacterium sp. DB0501]NGM37853.1 phenylacetate--CoA ligase [Methylobacterium sp. DB0501]
MPHTASPPATAPEATLARLPAALGAALKAPAYAAHLAGIDPASVTDRAALARLPVLRKGEMPARQREALPFGGFVPGSAGAFPRLFTSPGPIFEPQRAGEDPWGGAPALAAAGFEPGDVVLNTFGYHLTPGGFIFDTAARALGCAVIPAGPGNTEQQLDLIEAYRPAGYVGTPDFLKVLLDAGAKAGRDVSSIVKALVSGAAFPPSLQTEFKERGIAAAQAYATADVGFIAYETPGEPGLLVGDGLILEIVRPGTGDPVPEGEVGEIVVTVPDLDRPLIRYALGDLTAASGKGRIRGWMGRADQAAKVKGMFVRPEQVAEIARRHPGLGRLRLVVTRANEADAMTLRAEAGTTDATLAEAVAETLRAVTKLRGTVDLVASGSLPNDGKVIADERPLG